MHSSNGEQAASLAPPAQGDPGGGGAVGALRILRSAGIPLAPRGSVPRPGRASATSSEATSASLNWQQRMLVGDSSGGGWGGSEAKGTGGGGSSWEGDIGWQSHSWGRRTGSGPIAGRRGHRRVAQWDEDTAEDFQQRLRLSAAEGVGGNRRWQHLNWQQQAQQQQGWESAAGSSREHEYWEEGEEPGAWEEGAESEGQHLTWQQRLLLGQGQARPQPHREAWQGGPPQQRGGRQCGRGRRETEPEWMQDYHTTSDATPKQPQQQPWLTTPQQQPQWEPTGTAAAPTRSVEEEPHPAAGLPGDSERSAAWAPIAPAVTAQPATRHGDDIAGGVESQQPSSDAWQQQQQQQREPAQQPPQQHQQQPFPEQPGNASCLPLPLSLPMLAMGAAKAQSSGLGSPGNECCVCLDAPATAVCLPCGHQCLCRQCAGVYRQWHTDCPSCRTELQGLFLFREEGRAGVIGV